MTTKISFTTFVAECLQHAQDGMIMESEMATKITAAANGQFSFVELPTKDYEALGLDRPAPKGWDKADTSHD